MDINVLIKPFLLLNGVAGLRIRFDSAEAVIIATGTQRGKQFEIKYTFQEIEAAINGPSSSADGQDEGGSAPLISPGGDRPT